MTALRSTTGYRAHRGQALIMAVLLMFLLVGLAGVFIATINRTLVQTARAAERDKLEQIAQSGMKLAESELHQGVFGADWRPDAGPDANNPGWQYDGNGGFYKTTVTYGGINGYSDSEPFLQNPLDRYLKVDVEARFTLDNQPNVIGSEREVYEEGYAEGRKPNKKFLTRKITAYVPIALTDYLVWVTNLYETGEPATLGSDIALSNLRTVMANPETYNDETLNTTAIATAINVNILSTYDGPLRSESDLRLGNARIDLTRNDASYRENFRVLREDMLQVRGMLSEYADSTAASRRLLVNKHNMPMATIFSTTNLDPVADRAQILSNITLVQYLQTEENAGPMSALRAPKLDGDGLDRYRKLTRDSGAMGIYIENPAEVQHRDKPDPLESLRQEWLNPDSDDSASCWENGVYKPDDKEKAVRIVLNDWEYESDSNTAVAVAIPTIDLYAGGNIFKDENGDSTSHISVIYPRNGVIFAEGNVVVTGHLPAAVAYDSNSVTGLAPIFGTNGDQRPGGWNASDGSIRYYVSPANRRFDLTVVSAATVYIEGSLLGPASREDNGGYYLSQSAFPPNTYIRNGSEYDTKIALLAVDNVCLNPTRIFEQVTDIDGNLISPVPDVDPLTSEWYWKATASAENTAFVFSFRTAGRVHPRTRLLLRQAAEANADASATAMQAAVLRMTVNDQYPFYWNKAAGETSATNLYLCNSAVVSTLYPWLDALLPAVPDDPDHHEWPDKQWGGGSYKHYLVTPPFNTFGMQSWDVANNARYSGLAASMTPLWSFNRWNSFLFHPMDIPEDPYDGAPYLLHAGNRQPTVATERYGPGVLATCVDLQVDALIYAQRGSWFIIPGAYWHDSSNGTATKEFKWPFPKYREPYDVRIIVHGAIAANSTAPADAQQQWIEHWRGANIWYFDANGDGRPDMQDPGMDSSLWNATDWRWNGNGDNRRMGITYTYDATLARPICFDVDPSDPSIRYYTPRLPKLPVGPELLFVQEEEET